MLTYSLEYLWYNLCFNPLWQDRVKWIATFFIYASAVAMSLSTALRMEPIIFYSFIIGHVLWGLVGLAMKDRPLVALNWGFIPLDIIAIVITP